MIILNVYFSFMFISSALVTYECIVLIKTVQMFIFIKTIQKYVR